MKKSLAILVIFFIALGALWAQAPDWVELYMEGRISEIAGVNYYVGVGESSSSMDEADQNARVNFAKAVETNVTSTMEEVYRQEGDMEEATLEATLSVQTDVSLKGITISQQYTDEDQGIFYSMIKILRQDYTLILEQNIREELAVQQAELERRQIELEQEQMAQDQEMAEFRLEEQRRENQLARYADYLEREPYPMLVSFENAEMYHGRQHINGSFNMSKSFALRNLAYSVNFFDVLQVGTNHIFDFDTNTTLVYSDLDAKFALLDNNGTMVKVSAAIGGRLYMIDPVNNLDDISQGGGTLYGVANIAVPQLYYTDYSLYVGLDKAALGVAWYPLFKWMEESVGVLAESVYYFNPEMRYGETERAFRFQMGLQFRPADAACTRITWEDNFQTFGLSLDINL